ncbi:MAG: dockerin type I repeat-containing protein [Clostridia bacterium]|nr:dockerin type I repeat-containing protein [Clostridia bacterium]
MKSFTKKVLALCLTVCIVLASASSALASTWVADTELLKEQYTNYFTRSANLLKTDKPALTITKSNGVPEGGLTIGNDQEQDRIAEEAERYLLPWLDSIFNKDTSFSIGLIEAIFGEENKEKSYSKQLAKGMDRDDLLPVYGENYVCDLAAADDFDLIVDKDDQALTPSQLAVIFRDMPLEEAKESSIAKAFSLPSGTLNPTFITGVDPTQFALEDVHFTDFRIENAKIVTKYDVNGQINSYASMLDCKFQINFLDAMHIVGALMGFNVYEAVLLVMNLAYASLGQEGVTEEELLRDRYITVTYRMITRIENISFADRQFGDVDGDGIVTAADARIALRHSVDLDPIKNAFDQIYADVNFDGTISADDARLILRMSVDLEEKFTEIPEGKSILIVNLENI